jgi:hypothetical protein
MILTVWMSGLGLSALGGCGSASIMLEGEVGVADSGAAGVDDTGLSDSGDAGGGETGVDTGDTGDTGTPGDTDPPSWCPGWGLLAEEGVSLAYGVLLDGYDASAGAYGGGNVSSGQVAVNARTDCAFQSGATVRADIQVGADPAEGYCEDWGASLAGSVSQLSARGEMPLLEAPSGLPASLGDITVGWEETREIDGDTQFGDLTVAYGATLVVTRPATVVVEDLRLEGGSITLASGATLDLHVLGDAALSWGTALNVGGRPVDTRLWLVNGGSFRVAGGATLAAIVVGPHSSAQVDGEAYGALVVNDLASSWGGKLHLDASSTCP